MQRACRFVSHGLVWRALEKPATGAAEPGTQLAEKLQCPSAQTFVSKGLIRGAQAEQGERLVVQNHTIVDAAAIRGDYRANEPVIAHMVCKEKMQGLPNA